MDEAIDTITSAEIRQPSLFSCNAGEYFVKLDKKAVRVNEPSCFADCIDLLVKCFFVFSVEYPDELRLVYGLFECFMAIPISIGNSSILADFLRSINFVD